jgi:hypothetical protein
MLLVGMLAFTVFRLSPNRALADSFYSTLLSWSVLTSGSVHLEPFLGSAVDMQGLPGFVPASGRPYQIESAGGHLYYWYPPAPSVLAIPLVAGAAAFGLGPLGADGRYDPLRDVALHGWLGPVVSAAIVAVLFQIAAVCLAVPVAAGVAFAAALGSPIWSTLSRGMSSNTWLVLLLSVVALELLRSARDERPPRAVLLATLLAWGYLSRPATSIAIACITVWMVLRHPRRFVGFAITGAVWAAAFFGYSMVQFGTWLPSYYRLAATMSLAYVIPSVEGLLLSPSRGLFVYSPIVLWVAWLVIRHRRAIRFPDLALLSVAILVGTFLPVSTWRVWWGGHSYGPRLCADFVPWIFLLAVLALDARQRTLAEEATTAPSRRRLELAIGLGLALASATLHAPGALQSATLLWNERLGPEDGEPPLLWDWSHPQFLAAYRMPPRFVAGDPSARRPPTD